MFFCCCLVTVWRRQWHPLQYSCLENPMDGGAWYAAVDGVPKSRTRLSDFTFIFHFHSLEKEIAAHSSVLAWRIPGTAEPGGLPSMGSHRVGHDWSDLAAAAAAVTKSCLTFCNLMDYNQQGETRGQRNIGEFCSGLPLLFPLVLSILLLHQLIIIRANTYKA